MVHQLQNRHFSVSVKEQGAELCSFLKKETQTEYIWQGNPTFWKRHAPVLFPFVGGLKNQQYEVEGKIFRMGQHGFARDRRFTKVAQTASRLVFELNADMQTYAKYPFPFQLQIAYELMDNQLKTTYKVINPIHRLLLFSIGGHPAFNCPLNPSEQRSDYQLIFNQKETATTQLLDGGLRTDKKKLILDNADTIPITDELFDADALIFDDLKSNSVQLYYKNTPVLKFDFTGFPYLGIWSRNRQAPFVCIEPWYGVADHVGHNGVLADKEGIIALEGGAAFECSYVVEVI